MKALLRILACPFVFMVIWIAYIFHAFRNTYGFLKYGGEWITYVKKDRETIHDIFLELKINKLSK